VISLSPLTVQIPDAWVRAFNRTLTRIADADPTRVTAVDVASTVAAGGRDYRWDGVHYTEAGASALAERLQPAIDAARNAPAAPLPDAPPSCAPGAVA
jgi:lysophospholipase L1-like esterase